MALGTGLDAFIGIADEVTYGTYVAPTRFYEFLNESLAPNVGKIYSTAIGTGRVQRTNRRKTYITGAGGDFQIEAANRGLGLLLKHMFGDVATAQVASTTEYTHTFTPDLGDGKRGRMASVQVGRPSTDGTIRPFSYTGGKVIGWEFESALDEILKITTTWDFKTETTAETVATPSYATSPELFTFVEGTLSIDSTSVGTAKAMTIGWEEALDTERRYLGNSKAQPLANGMLAITGTIESEFNDLTAHAAWVAGTEIVDLVLTFTGSTIPSESNPYKLVITIPSLEYTGDPPQVGGPEIVQQNTPFQALYNGTDAAITAVYHTDDETP